MIKRLIFDVDGTLIRGVTFTNSIERTLKRFNIYSEENVRSFIEATRTYENSHDNYNKADYTAHVEKLIKTKVPDNFLATFFDELRTCTEPINQELIEKLQTLSEKYELVLLTNYFAESQLNRLNTMEIGKYFSECYGENKIKPNREAYISACGNNKKSECIMIGDDAFLDIRRAKQEGLNTIFVNTKKINVSPEIGVVVNSVEEITERAILKAENIDIER